MFGKLFAEVLVRLFFLGEFLEEKFQDFINKHRTPIILGLIVISIQVLVVMVIVDNWADWTGFGRGDAIEIGIKRDKSGDIVSIATSEPGKTLWDWLSLLGVPLSIAVLGIYYQRKEQKRIADNEKEEILQTYYDRLSSLIIEKNLLAISTRVYENPKRLVAIVPYENLQVKHPIPTDEERELVTTAMDVIRARTLSILRRLKDDPVRKESVIQFLLDVDILGKTIFNLSHADLSGINFVFLDTGKAQFSDINLEFANLRNANLRGINLSGTKLSGADLSGSKLGGADLSNTSLVYAKLRDTGLMEANLSYADLRGADLRDAFLFDANLSNANLSGAKVGGSGGGLEMAKLCHTTLPKSFFLKFLNSNRDCERLGINPDTEKHTR